jgi:glycine C-acetyltransferase
MLTKTPDFRERLFANTSFFRQRLTEIGFTVLPGEHPIVPVMLGDASLATRLADALLQKRVYVIGFSYPVVPQGKARIRVQLSAAHTRQDLEFAAQQFAAAKSELGI